MKENRNRNKNKFLNSLIMILLLIVLVGGSYAFFAYSRTGTQNSKMVSGNIYMRYDDVNELVLNDAFPQTKEKGILNNYFEFSVEGKNTTRNEDIYYAINLVYGSNWEERKRFHDEDIVFYLTEVIDGEEEVLIDSVQYKNFNDAKIWVEKISRETDEKIKHTYRLRAWISDSVLISDSDSKANYTTGEYRNSYTSIKINVVGNLQENDINMILDANDDNIINGRRAIDVDSYGYANDNLTLEVTSDNKNVKFMYTDEIGNSSEELSDSLSLKYNTLRKDIITTRVILVPENDANTKANIYFKLTRNGEVVEEQVKSVLVYGNNYCLNNGFNKLYDCILVSEKMSNSVSAAKSAIEAKGEPNLNDTAPSYIYVEDITYDVENVYSVVGYKFYFGDSYEFNSTTGKFNLYNKDGSKVVADTLSNNYKNYYTCGSTDNTYTCTTIYRINETSVSGTTYTITNGDKITYKVSSSIRSEVGLYKAEDDYGDAYVYRGDVINNNVYFGGYYWKIIRTNGDNSIRLIYSGAIPNATEYNTSINNNSYAYTVKYPKSGILNDARESDPTYVGW